MQAQPQYRYRLTFSKGYAVKYVAHLDMVLTWTRAFRRCRIPLAYTKGFNPQAKIQVASSLPVGVMGSAEKMDIYLTEYLEPADILSRVQQSLPGGFGLSAVEPVDLKAPALQSLLREADYKVKVETNRTEADLQTALDELLKAESLIQTRIRRKKEETYDMRPLVHTLKLLKVENNEALIQMRLSAGQHGNLRPEAILQAIGLTDTWFEVERTKLHFTFDT